MNSIQSGVILFQMQHNMKDHLSHFTEKIYEVSTPARTDFLLPNYVNKIAMLIQQKML